jgi:hypothetical protein
MLRKALPGLIAFLLAANAMAAPIQRQLPLPYQVDSGPVRTLLCAEVTELVYETSTWWKPENQTVDEPQRALQQVLDAIARQDSQALEKLTYLAGPRKEQQQQQLKLMIQQSSYLKNISAVRMYEVGSLLVAYVHLEVNGKSGPATFVFDKHDNRLLLLAERPRNPAFTLLREWASSPWGVVGTGAPGYCSSPEVARTNVRLTYSSTQDAEFPNSIAVAMKVIPVAGKPVDAGMASRLVTTFSLMRDAVQKDDLGQLLTFVNPDDVAALREAMTKPEYSGQRALLKQTFGSHGPVAVVDGGPLLVLYTRAAPGDHPKSWFFVLDPDERPRWTNLSRLNQIDALFSSGPLFEAARSDPALASLLAKP